MVSESSEPIIAQGEYSFSIGGGRPDTGATVVTATFHVEGTKTLLSKVAKGGLVLCIQGPSRPMNSNTIGFRSVVVPENRMKFMPPGEFQ